MKLSNDAEKGMDNKVGHLFYHVLLMPLLAVVATATVRSCLIIRPPQKLYLQLATDFQ